MTDTVQLGDITLEEWEIPSEIRLGTAQSLKVFQFVGNKRAIDVMGADPKPIEWSGLIRGPDALERAQSLNAMCVAGRELAFTWRSISYTVVLADFEFTPKSFREVPYRLTLEPVRDEAAPEKPAEASPTTMIKGDLSTADQLAELLAEAEADPDLGGTSIQGALSSDGELERLLGKARLSDQVNLANAAGAKVQDFVTAPTSSLRAILGPVIAAQNIASGLIRAAEAVTTSVAAVGGVLPGMAGRDLSGGLLRQLYAMEDQANLYDIGNVLGRVEVNVGAVSTAGASVVMGGADLFKVAERAYGDATEWATIARANGLTDPLVDGIAQITIPATPRNTGGVLG